MPYKLLLADDSVTIQRVIELTFADEDVKVTAVGDGQSAIDRIEADPPDIVLADVGMPALDGYEVSAFIKDSPALSHIPVLLLTGAFEPVDEARAQAVRCDGVLAKPFEPQLLIARVKELLAGDGAAGSADEVTDALGAGSGETPADKDERSGAQSTAREDDDTGPVPVAAAAHAFTPDDFALGGAAAPDPVPSPTADISLDDYFDRLDAAFASLTGVPAGQLKDAMAPPDDSSWAPPSAGAWSPADPGSLASTPVATQLPAAAAAMEPEPVISTEPASPASVTVADAFAALLDAEQQGKVLAPVSVEPLVPPVVPVVTARDAATAAAPAPAAAAAPAVTEALVDEVVERLVARLGGETLQAKVLEIVSETAERLVREEIARLKAQA